MATIKISDLASTGAELFHDSESFLNELTNQEINDVLGGGRLLGITVGGQNWYFSLRFAEPNK